MVSDDLTKLGYASLNPMQEKAIEQGFLREPRVLVSAPTASGKTLLALLAEANFFKELERKRKAVYIVPLKALANEKHEEFTAALAPYGIRVGVSTGDMDSSSPELGGYDFIIVTSEKMDSLLRHKAQWIKEVGLAVVDEIHLLNDYARGATLEIILTKLLKTDAKIIGLSATIGNPRELAEWLGAKLIESDYRPTKLVLGICTRNKLFLESRAEKMDSKKALETLVEKALGKGKGQALVFVSTRKSAEATARMLANVTRNFLTDAEKNRLSQLSSKALRVFNPPTEQCRILADCIRSGIAFHHAGIEGKKRKIIEEGFKKERALKVIVCTTTLAMGIDYPASWVIARDLKRYTGVYADYIPKLEVMQMLGRAGRPRYDSTGYGVMVCSPDEADFVREKYVFGPLEKIYSKLSSEPALRTHSLALVATGYCNSFKELFEFFESTFYAFQYGDTASLLAKVEKVVGELKEMDFLREKKSVLVATPLGKRVSELYLDPLSAHSFIEFIKRRKKPDAFNYLLRLCSATEMRPFLPVKRSEENALWEEAYALMDDFELEEFEKDEEALEKYKTAKVLNAWINEETEEKILEQFGLPPGLLFARKTIAEWLAYSIGELAFILNEPEVRKSARIVARRIKHGVKEELLELCRMKGIGRVRGRKLFVHGVRNISEFRARPKEEIKKIVLDRRSTSVEIRSEADEVR
jgi:helicase